jgi:branched-chain amino acid aminotransferase
VFAVVNGEVLTPSRGVLEGITRRTVIEIAQDFGRTVHVGDIPAGALYGAQELFLTSTAGGVMPVATLDGAPVGEGRPGPVTTAIRDRYWELHRDPRYTLAVDYR